MVGLFRKEYAGAADNTLPDVSPETFVRKADLALRATEALCETAELSDLPSRASTAFPGTDFEPKGGRWGWFRKGRSG